jgi:hypothetical protein
MLGVMLSQTQLHKSCQELGGGKQNLVAESHSHLLIVVISSVVRRGVLMEKGQRLSVSQSKVQYLTHKTLWPKR